MLYLRPLTWKIKMETKLAIERAGSIATLARILAITPAAVYQWGETIPEPREWQLRVLRPEWFHQTPAGLLAKVVAKESGTV